MSNDYFHIEVAKTALEVTCMCGKSFQNATQFYQHTRDCIEWWFAPKALKEMVEGFMRLHKGALA